MKQFLGGLLAGILLTIGVYIGAMEIQGIRSAKKFLECYELGYQDEAKENPFVTMGCFMEWQMFDQVVRNNLIYDTKLDGSFVEREMKKIDKKYNLEGELPDETIPE